MEFARYLICATFVVTAFGQGVPVFEAAHVLYGSRPAQLAPGMILSLYGANLGPAAGCEGHADTQQRETPSPLRPKQSFVETLMYPKQLCDTEVWVGGNPAELLYVSAGQINFKVPQETPVQGTADVRVVYQGQSSSAVEFPLGVESLTISQESPVRAGMPVWLRVKLPYEEGPSLRYPFMIFPASFGCYEIEVRRDGKLLPRIADVASQALGGVIMSGNPCGSVALPSEPRFRGRLPLHLQYRFDQPGTYEVRLTERRPGLQEPPVVTDWMRISILPASAGDRERWLTGQSAHAPTNSADLISDFLPGILGIPDDQSLAILTRYLYHADRIVREYAMYGLTYWPERKAAAAVLDLMRARGPSDAAINFLAHVKGLDAAQVAEVSIPNLQSDSPVLALGALRAISGIVLPTDSHVSPELRARGEDALIHAADRFAEADAQTVNDYVSALGQVQDARAHDLLWDLINRRWLRTSSHCADLAQISGGPTQACRIGDPTGPPDGRARSSQSSLRSASRLWRRGTAIPGAHAGSILLPASSR